MTHIIIVLVDINIWEIQEQNVRTMKRTIILVYCMCKSSVRPLIFNGLEYVYCMTTAERQVPSKNGRVLGMTVNGIWSWGPNSSGLENTEYSFIAINSRSRWRCPLCYRYRKWKRRHEFKFWTRLIAFHIALIPLGKVLIQLFSLQLWINSRTDWVLHPWWSN